MRISDERSNSLRQSSPRFGTGPRNTGSSNQRAKTARMWLIRVRIRKKDSDAHSRAGVLLLVHESNVSSSVGAWLLARVDDVATDLFVALQL